jgi:hypothetical protein
MICPASVLLNCRYQLVYACGDPQLLPWLAERAAAVQAVTRALRSMVDAGHPAVTDPKVAVWLEEVDRFVLQCCCAACHLVLLFAWRQHRSLLQEFVLPHTVHFSLEGGTVPPVTAIANHIICAGCSQ